MLTGSDITIAAILIVALALVFFKFIHDNHEEKEKRKIILRKRKSLIVEYLKVKDGLQLLKDAEKRNEIDYVEWDIVNKRCAMIEEILHKEYLTQDLILFGLAEATIDCRFVSELLEELKRRIEHDSQSLWLS